VRRNVRHFPQLSGEGLQASPNLACAKPQPLASTSQGFFPNFSEFIAMQLLGSPARDMSHPREKFNQVSTWECSASETTGKIVDEFGGTILFRLYWRATVDNREGRRYRGAAKMPVPIRGLRKPVATQNDSFCHLLLVVPFNQAFGESFIGSPTHPTPTEESLEAVDQLGKVQMPTLHRIETL
jgi:hypothetical protein